MLAYALFVGFIGTFIVLTTIGHVLVLMAVWPNIFGWPDRDLADARREFAPGKPAAPHSPELAA